MMRSAQAELEDSFAGFDADDEFALPGALSETPDDDMDFPLLPAPRLQPVTDDTLAPEHAPNPIAALLASAEAALGEVTVPRISIHVFCQRPETTAIAEQVGADRRLARATTVVRSGGLAEALALYQNQPTPSLVIAESADDAAILLGQLDQLAEVCDPGTKVVVIGTHNDIPLYRELMRRGVSEYLVPPISVLQMIRAVTTLYSDPATPFIGRTLAFLGAKGGVGSSTLAHNIAFALAEHMQAATTIVDYDLPFGTAGLDFNQDPLQGFADALSKPDRLDPVLLDRMTARCGERLSLFAAPASLDEDSRAQRRHLRGGAEQDPRHRPLRGAGPAPPVVGLDAAHPAVGRRRGGGGDAGPRLAPQRQEPARPGQEGAAQRQPALPDPEPGGRARPPGDPGEGLLQGAGVRARPGICPSTPSCSARPPTTARWCRSLRPRPRWPRAWSSSPRCCPAAKRP